MQKYNFLHYRKMFFAKNCKNRKILYLKNSNYRKIFFAKNCKNRKMFEAPNGVKAKKLTSSQRILRFSEKPVPLPQNSNER